MLAPVPLLYIKNLLFLEHTVFAIAGLKDEIENDILKYLLFNIIAADEPQQACCRRSAIFCLKQVDAVLESSFLG